jgi:hypothetical protein
MVTSVTTVACMPQLVHPLYAVFAAELQVVE